MYTKPRNPCDTGPTHFSIYFTYNLLYGEVGDQLAPTTSGATSRCIMDRLMAILSFPPYNTATKNKF